MLQQNVLIWRYRLVCCARWVDPSMSMATPVSHVGTRQPRSFAYRPAPRRPRRRPVTRPAAAAARRLASAPRPRPRPVVGAAARPRQSCVPSAKNGGCHKAGSRQGAVPWADIRQSVGADAAESSCAWHHHSQKAAVAAPATAKLGVPWRGKAVFRWGSRCRAVPAAALTRHPDFPRAPGRRSVRARRSSRGPARESPVGHGRRDCFVAGRGGRCSLIHTC